MEDFANHFYVRFPENLLHGEMYLIYIRPNLLRRNPSSVQEKLQQKLLPFLLNVSITYGFNPRYSIHSLNAIPSTTVVYVTEAFVCRELATTTFFRFQTILTKAQIFRSLSNCDAVDGKQGIISTP